VVGEGARDAISQFIFRNDPEQQADAADATQEAKRVIEQGALGFGTEFGARGVGAIGAKIGRPFELSAATVKAAKTGQGMRLTPGEASGNVMLKKLESATAHLPGGMTKWETYRGAQARDSANFFSKQLAKMARDRVPAVQLGQAVQDFVGSAGRHIDTAYQAESAATLRNLGIDSPATEEVAGKAAQKAVAGSREAMTAKETANYDEVKKLLGVNPKTFITPEQIDAAIAKKIEFYKQMGGGEPPVVAKLREARGFTRNARQGGESKLMDRLLHTPPETVGRYLQTRAPLADLREFGRVMPKEVQQQVGQTMLKRMAKESTDAAGQVSGKKLAAQLAKLGEERGPLIYGADRWKQMTTAAERLRTLEETLPQARKAFQSELMRQVATSKDPEAVAALFEGANVLDIRSLHAAMPEPMRQQVSANVLEGIVRRSADPQTGRLGARSIAGSLEELGEGKGRLIFGKQYEAILEGSRLMDRMKAPGGEGLGQMHAVHNASAIAAAAGSIAAMRFGYGMEAAAGLAGAYGAVRVITGALTNPATAAMALKILRMAAAGTLRSVPYAVDQLAAPNYKDTYLQAPQ